jgi:membrane-bound lytic murein transglycosylase B
VPRHRARPRLLPRLLLGVGLSAALAATGTLVLRVAGSPDLTSVALGTAPAGAPVPPALPAADVAPVADTAPGPTASTPPTPSSTTPTAPAYDAPARAQRVRVPGVERLGIGEVGRIASVDEMPEAAASAYRFAEVVIDAAPGDCRVPWTVLAAVLQVQSDHGRAGDRELREDGTVAPRLVGQRRARAGQPGMRDTDGGALDRDRRFDRPVGPAGFWPWAWRAYGVDGDDDGRRDPQDLDDVALALAVLLCADRGDLAERQDLRRALDAVLPAQWLVRAVVRQERAYRSEVAAGVDRGEPPVVVRLGPPPEPEDTDEPDETDASDEPDEPDAPEGPEQADGPDGDADPAGAAGPRGADGPKDGPKGPSAGGFTQVPVGRQQPQE